MLLCECVSELALILATILYHLGEIMKCVVILILILYKGLNLAENKQHESVSQITFPPKTN